ncbi:glutaredoxin family protein [Acidipropionibacterium timonense]|uniref:glutaredoxin family protein n=1 Tax=Acidipropionibacterium timonense TaxID=2161818 RepID=UPI001FD92123|nr:glutaredoxin family protein [Acidipropionibacterium timonense]
MIGRRPARRTPDDASPDPLDHTPSSSSTDGTRAPVEGCLVVLVRSGCHLCDEVTATIDELRGQQPDVVPEPVLVDVDADPTWRRRWGDHVPVTFVDGTLIAYWFLDGATLVAALTDGPVAPTTHP